MAIIFYLPNSEKAGEDLLNCLITEHSLREIVICRAFLDLHQKLRSSASSTNILVLLYMTKADLQDIFALGKSLQGVKIILVFPDDGTDTMIEIFSLRRCSVSWMDNNFTNIVTVLKRMLNLYDVPISEENRESVITIELGQRNAPSLEITVLKEGTISQWN